MQCFIVRYEPDSWESILVPVRAPSISTLRAAFDAAIKFNKVRVVHITELLAREKEILTKPRTADAHKKMREHPLMKTRFELEDARLAPVKIYGRLFPLLFRLSSLDEINIVTLEQWEAEFGTEGD